MSREKLVQEVINKGWKIWGNLTRKKGKTYQCFRRKNDYIWIGLRYVERSNQGHAIDFVVDGQEGVNVFT